MFRSKSGKSEPTTAAPDRKSLSRLHSMPSGELRSVARTPYSPASNSKPSARGFFRSKSCNEQSFGVSQSPTKSPRLRIFFLGGRQIQEQPRKSHSTISPQASPTSTVGNKKIESLPCPKSPLRVTFRRKATKGPKKKKSSLVEEVNESYDEDGVLERTTITRTTNADGTTSSETHKERIRPGSPKYPKNKSIKARREAEKAARHRS